jgi:hypothetical protein
MALSAQQTPKEKAWKNGFERLYFEDGGDTVRISFEHRIFRQLGHSMDLLSLVLEEEIGGRPVLFYPRYHSVLLGEYEGEKGWSAISEDLTSRIQSQTNLVDDYRVQLTLVPEFAARFGYYEQPVQEMTNLILSTQVFLLPGLSVQSGILFPISNTLNFHEKNIRLAPSNLRFFKVLNRQDFFSLSSGLFYSNRYGVIAEYRHMNLNKDFSFGTEISYTGYYYLPRKGIFRTGLDQWVALADVEYRLPFEPLISLKLTGGQFLNRDLGLRMDLISQYGAVDVGFFAAQTQAGFNGGFQVAFPLWPGKLVRTKKIELRTTEEFRWEYGYNNEEVVGRNFRLGFPKLADWTRQYHKKVVGAK